MAFDLIGASPRNFDGKWVRLNIWRWHEIWRSCRDLWPELVSQPDLWYTNIGEFVSEESCLRLAQNIEKIGYQEFAQYAYDNHTIKDFDIAVVCEFIPYHIIDIFVLFLKNCGGFYIK